MARINLVGQSWGEWFRPRYLAMGMSGTEFAQKVADAGGSATTSKQTVSQWANGQNATDANTAVIVATIFGEPAEDALRAAGFGVVADAMGKRPLREAGGEPEPLDEAIRIILARKTLTPEDQADAIAHYNRRKARLLAEVTGIIDAMHGPDNESESA